MNFDSSRFFDLRLVSYLKITHIVDLNQNFQRNRLAQSSDFCFATSSFILESLKRYNSGAFFINHGYSVRSVESIKKNDNKVHVGYIGNLAILTFIGN